MQNHRNTTVDKLAEQITMLEAENAELKHQLSLRISGDKDNNNHFVDVIAMVNKPHGNPY